MHEPSSLACRAVAVFGLWLAVPWPAATAESLETSIDSLTVRTQAAPSGPLTLGSALALAARHHPRLRGAAWRTRAAAARQRDAARWPNPTLAAEVQDFGGDFTRQQRELTLSAAQTLELGGDRGARAATARALVSLAAAELSSEQRDVLSATAERFLDVWTLQERAVRLAAAESLAQETIAAAEARFRAGAGPELEQFRAEAVHARRQAERRRAVAELAAGRQRLAGEWGSVELRADSLMLEPPPRRAIPSPSALFERLAAHPKSMRAAAEVALEAARAREARAARVPDLEVSGGVRHVGDGAAGFVASLALPLPLWSRRSGGVAAAEADHQAALAREDLAALELSGALRGAHDDYLAATDILELVRARVKPKTEETLRQLARGYRSGRFSSLEYLEGQRSVLEAELALVEATAEAWRARLMLERLLGVTIEQLEQEVDR